MYKKPPPYTGKGCLEITQDLRNEVAELKRAITLKNRKIKRLESKVDNLQQGKQLRHVQAENEKLKKELNLMKKRFYEF